VFREIYTLFTQLWQVDVNFAEFWRQIQQTIALELMADFHRARFSRVK